MNDTTNQPRIVTPEEAQEWIRRDRRVHDIRLLHTVATEPDRTRAAVEVWRDRVRHLAGDAWLAMLDQEDADAIENGAPL